MELKTKILLIGSIIIPLLVGLVFWQMAKDQKVRDARTENDFMYKTYTIKTLLVSSTSNRKTGSISSYQNYFIRIIPNEEAIELKLPIRTPSQMEGLGTPIFVDKNNNELTSQLPINKTIIVKLYKPDYQESKQVRKSLNNTKIVEVYELKDENKIFLQHNIHQQFP